MFLILNAKECFHLKVQGNDFKTTKRQLLQNDLRYKSSQTVVNCVLLLKCLMKLKVARMLELTQNNATTVLTFPQCVLTSLISVFVCVYGP